ncbi:MAG: histidine--tRNA ligase [Candidatus Methanophagaceae archaeon]|nr:MAG: histidine--tRNA ligase [Methanophagales archaeon]
MRIERARGTRDFLPAEMKKRRMIEAKMREIAERWGYEEISTPTFELAELFTLKSGEGILKEMYEFRDKSGRHLALRPELTAPVIRLYVNELKMAPKPTKVYYFGNCFRYEEPQRARYREFWQFGAEIIGSDRPEAEAELIALAYHITKALGIKAELHVGHVGLLRELLRTANMSDATISRAMRLIDKGAKSELSELMSDTGIESGKKKDLIRLIDSRGEAAVEEARRMIADDNDSDGEVLEQFGRLEQLLELLRYYGVVYTPNLGIARGLDYYTGMVFEIYEAGDKLGAQRQICGGGTYRLAALFGSSEDTPSTGFAFGFDRLAEILQDAGREYELKKATVVVVPVRAKDKKGQDHEVIKAAIRITAKLRERFITYLDLMNRSIREQLAYANTINASFAVLVGERELEVGKVTLRDLKTGEQDTMSLEECMERLEFADTYYQ